MDIITIVGIKNQINTVNNEIADYVNDKVCSLISTSKEVDCIFFWTLYDDSKDTLFITANNVNAFSKSWGTIVIEFKMELGYLILYPQSHLLLQNLRLLM